MFLTILALLLQGFVVLGVPVESGPPSISLRLSPRSGFAPFSTRATLTIPRNVINREWCLVWGDELSEVGRTCKSMEGERAPVTREFVISHLDQGDYGVRGELYTSEGDLVTQVVRLQVLGGGE